MDKIYDRNNYAAINHVFEDYLTALKIFMIFSEKSFMFHGIII